MEDETSNVVTLSKDAAHLQNDERTCHPAGTVLTQPRSADVLRFRVKVPQTLDQAAKLRNWLERQRHKTPWPAQNYLSNIVAQCKSIKDEHDLKRVQPMIAWQAERLAGATLG